MDCFTIGGSAGDVIASLAIMRDIGRVGFYLNRNCHPGWKLPEEYLQSLKGLIEIQPYIHDCQVVDGIPSGSRDLDHWRNSWRHGFNLSDMIASHLGMPHTSRTEPWLFVEPKRIAEYTIARSHRYHAHFPWQEVKRKYEGEAIFLGNKEEHDLFCNLFGPLSWWYTPSFLEAARVLAGAKYCHHNQSSLFWISEGLKKEIWAELVPGGWAWNCDWNRPGFHRGWPG